MMTPEREAEYREHLERHEYWLGLSRRLEAYEHWAEAFDALQVAEVNLDLAREILEAEVNGSGSSVGSFTDNEGRIIGQEIMTTEGSWVSIGIGPDSTTDNRTTDNRTTDNRTTEKL